MSRHYLRAALKPKHNPSVPVSRSRIEECNPEPLVPFHYRQRLLFKHIDKGFQFLAFPIPFFFFGFEGVVMLQCGVIA
jgi:hypothetical protein